MFGVAIVGKQDVKKDIVNAILDKKHAQLNAIAIIVKMVKMKIYIMKLEDKMNNQNNQKDKDLIDHLVVVDLFYIVFHSILFLLFDFFSIFN